MCLLNALGRGRPSKISRCRGEQLREVHGTVGLGASHPLCKDWEGLSGGGAKFLFVLVSTLEIIVPHWVSAYVFNKK